MNTNELMIVDQTDINDKIYNVRGLQVMLDSDIAELFGVETKADFQKTFVFNLKALSLNKFCGHIL